MYYPFDIFQNMTVDNFNPDLYVPQIHVAFGLNNSFALTSTMKTIDLFTPRVDNRVCTRHGLQSFKPVIGLCCPYVECVLSNSIIMARYTRRFV